MSTQYLTVVPIGAPAPQVPVPATTYPYTLDNFQQHAIAAISRDENVLVTAKTGSGKTLVGEYQIAHSLRAGRRVFYTTPIKSLSNQKFHDLTNCLGTLGYPDARVGIMTGDIKYMPDADVVIMTTEILRNMLYKAGTATAAIGLTASLSLDRLDAVVFDECHYINDPDRGRVWEETMILLPPEVKLVLLSATIDRPELFAGWLGALRERPISLIATSHRVVPLTHYAGRIEADGNLELVPIMATGGDSKEHYDQNAYRAYLEDKSRDHKKAQAFARSVAGRASEVQAAKADAAAHNGSTVVAAPAAQGKARETSFIHQLNATVNALKVRDLLPALVFAFSRADTERYAAAIEGSLIDSSDSAAVANIFDYHLRNHKELQAVDQYWTLRSLLVRGVAFHHSGVLPLLKEIVEIIFSKGLARVLFCTETFAVGINMPTRTAIFVDLKKHDNYGLRIVRTDEYIQMAGRAGRRGKDVRGHVIYLPCRQPLEPEEMRRAMCGGMPQIQSRMDFGYEFILKTFHSGNDRWAHVIRQSYWYLQAQHTLKVLRLEAERLAAAAAAHAAANGLTEPVIADLTVRAGHEAAIKAAPNNQVKKDAQRGLEQWKNRHLAPSWDRAAKAFGALKDLQKQKAEAEARAAEQAAELTDPYTMIECKVAYLQAQGYIEGDAKTLTPKGQAATEINEGHALMMMELYESGALTELSGQEILALLGAFLAEQQKGDDVPIEIYCSGAVAAAYKQLEGVRERLVADESAIVTTATDVDYWFIGREYVDLIYGWLDGQMAKDLCATYGCYEANLTKAVLKASNLLDELEAVATLRSEVGLLEKIVPMRPLLVRDIAQPDSLYLRL
jgi:superfamily II RNA helicase